MVPEPFFLPMPVGQRFCLFYRPDPSVEQRGAVVYIHPFAEEMNKSRRMAALQARAMAEKGYSVLQIDLLGCGDSSGDFGDASWSAWVTDVLAACSWIQQKTDAELWIWGLRTGCLLACEAANQIEQIRGLLLWQPVSSGKQFLQQFMRLKMASGMLAGESKGLMEQMRNDLAQGRPVEIAGYSISPGLTQGLETAELSMTSGGKRIEWIELSGKPDAALSPVAQMRLEKWRTEAHFPRGTVVCGPSFWQTVEIEECHELLEASLRVMAMDAAR